MLAPARSGAFFGAMVDHCFIGGCARGLIALVCPAGGLSLLHACGRLSFLQRSIKQLYPVFNRRITCGGLQVQQAPDVGCRYNVRFTVFYCIYLAL